MNGATPERIGVVGAGTMGAGIAQLAAQSGAATVLYDTVPEGLERGLQTIEKGLARQLERGRLSADESGAIRARVTAVSSLSELAGCGLVIEAAPERLDLKLELFGELAGIVDETCVLATNTSSLSITEIAAGDAASRTRRRSALLQPGSGDEARRGRRRRTPRAPRRWRPHAPSARRWAST